MPLRPVHCVLKELHLRGEPEAIVDALSILDTKAIADFANLTVECEGLNVEVTRAQNGATGRLVHTARLDTHIPVLNDINTADRVIATQFVKHLEDISGGGSLLLGPHIDHLDRVAVLPDDLDVIVRLLACVQRLRVPVGRVRRGGCRVFQHARLEGNMEKVVVHGIRGPVANIHGNRDVTLLSILQQISPALKLVVEFGDPPGHHAVEPGAESVGRQFETHLVVALAGGAVGHILAALLLCDGNHGLGDARTRERGAEQVARLINCVGADNGEHVVLHEILLQIKHVTLFGARCKSLGFDT
mmetsp:Transcript_45597/g.73508  ORF Transcript_45597/g.73508 Transcript_45597/m.73508 type:complete len:302 (-) Transcript_45597:278-1183(-)